MKNKKWLALLFLGLTAFYTQSCKQEYEGQQIEADQTPKVQLVKIAPLVATKTPIPIEASGMISSKAEMNLSFKIGGIIERLGALEGQRVRKGQLLAQLKTTEIDAQVLKAQQGVDKAKRDVVRIEKLYVDTVATLEQVEDLTTLLELAEADLEIAQFNQEYARIIAPTSGRLLKQFAEENELVGAGAPIFRLASSGKDAYIIKIGVADRDVIRLKINDKAEVRLDAMPTKVLTAYVSEIAQAADPRTGVFEIELTINKSINLPLRNGFIGKVKLFPSNQETYYKIDMNALVEGYQNKANIYIPINDTARKVTIRPEYIGGDYFTVSTEQLENVTAVITDGAAYLKDGEPIRTEEEERVTLK